MGKVQLIQLEPSNYVGSILNAHDFAKAVAGPQRLRIRFFAKLVLVT